MAPRAAGHRSQSPRHRAGGDRLPAQGRDREHLALELPVRPLARSAGRHAGGREPGDPQALRVHAGLLGAAAGDGLRDVRSRPRGGRDRRARARQGVSDASLGPPAVHGQHRGRPADRQGGRREPRPADARARRQEPGVRARRRRRRERGRPDPRHEDGQERADVHLARLLRSCRAIGSPSSSSSPRRTTPTSSPITPPARTARGSSPSAISSASTGLLDEARERGAEIVQLGERGRSTARRGGCRCRS